MIIHTCDISYRYTVCVYICSAGFTVPFTGSAASAAKTPHSKIKVVFNSFTDGTWQKKKEIKNSFNISVEASVAL